MEKKEFGSERILDLALISEFSYLNISGMSKEEKEILKSDNMNKKHALIRPSLYFKNTIVGNEHTYEMARITAEYDLIDYYNENILHHRQIVAMKHKKTGKVVFGVRGTDGIRDMITDAMIGVRRIGDKSTGARVLKGFAGLMMAVFPVTSATVATTALGMAKLSKEYSVKGYMRDAEKFINKVMLEHDVKKEDITIVGHSLGAIMAQLIAGRTGIEGHGFNGFSLEKDLLNEEELSHVAESFTNHSFDKDALSNLATDLVEDQVGKEEWYKSFDEESALSAHSIISFNRSLIRWVRTNKILGKDMSVEQMVEVMELHGRRDFMQMFLYKVLLKKEGSFLQFKEEACDFFKKIATGEIYQFYDMIIEGSSREDEVFDALEVRNSERTKDLRKNKEKQSYHKTGRKGGGK